MAFDPDWNAFVENPAVQADVSQLAACFGGAIAAQGCQFMLETPRLARRLSTLICSHFGLAPLGDDVTDEDRRIALTPMSEIEALAMRAGAISWSSSLAGAIGKEKVTAIRDQIGEELLAFALTNRDLASPPCPLEPVETIAARIYSDGRRCIAAWCETVSEPVTVWVKLKFPDNLDFDAKPMTGGAEILRRASEAAR